MTTDTKNVTTVPIPRELAIALRRLGDAIVQEERMMEAAKREVISRYAPDEKSIDSLIDVLRNRGRREVQQVPSVQAWERASLELRQAQTSISALARHWVKERPSDAVLEPEG